MSQPKSDFQLDNKGNIILHPVTGWIIGQAAEIAVLLALQYATRESEGKPAGQIQLVLTPQQSLELAAKLTSHANKVLALNRDKPIN